jgi:hypothetical protein
MKDEIASLQPALEGRPIDITTAARRLLFRRVFDLLGAPRGALWWQTSHPDLNDCAPILRVYPQYDWELHDKIFTADPTAAVFRTVGLVGSGSAGVAEEQREHCAPVTETTHAPSAKPVRQCHDIDGSSSWWLALMYVQGGLEQPWIRRYEEHFMRCPMCVYHIEIARLTQQMFPDAAREAQGLRQAVEAVA